MIKLSGIWLNEQKHVLFVVGKSLDENQSQSFKRVLMVSTPHSGKTTLMQGIMNFIVGVSYNDDFRLSFGQDLFSKVQTSVFSIIPSKPL